MDSVGIIQKAGYREEDLTPENKGIIRWLNWLKDDLIEYLRGEHEYSEDDGVIERAVKELAQDVIDDAESYLEGSIADIQIGLIESQDHKV